MTLSNRFTNIAAGALFTIMFLLAFFSLKGDSLTMDEAAHLPAGYSYLTQKDMRLNPEHPPLIKDLSGLPLLFIPDIKFPANIKSWTEDVNGQWNFGFYFLYQTGNPADKMIAWARFPMMIMMLLLGLFLFKWVRERYGNGAALLSAFLFTFSPTFLAHGRLVTTDVGAAFGAVIATYYFLKALENPGKKNIFFAGAALGMAELLKFSLILLAPFFVILGFVWWIGKFGKFADVFKTMFFVFLVGYLLVGAIYQYHVWNYPPEKQARDAKVYLASYPTAISDIMVWTADKPVFRAYGQYLTGLMMVFNRATGGNTTFFLGEVSNQGWKNYFPIVYAIKEPLTFHILTILALMYAAYLIKEPFWRNPFSRFKDWLKNHFTEFAMLLFIGIYWITSLTSNLNIGVRHLLPVFPFTFFLVAGATVSWFNKSGAKLKLTALAFLVAWQAASVFSVYPNFIAYFNELIGGPKQGYLYVADSNLDWGQDLKRLAKWADKKRIERIYLDYFGGGDGRYYFKQKYREWHGDYGSQTFPKGNYLAVSATFLQGQRALPGPGFNRKTDLYQWLDNYTPVTIIGNSIFVYYID